MPRTTVTLDADTEARLREIARERRISFKAAINETLRAGLKEDRTPGTPYREQTRPLGVLPGIDLTKALRLASALEDEETRRELERRR